MRWPDDIRRGDTLMREGRPAEALTHYNAAWSGEEGFSERHAFWILLSIGLAALRAGDPDQTLRALSGAQRHFAHSTGIVTGNPLFHLVAGLAADALGETPIAHDNLARALITGGPALFSGEDPRHLETVLGLLQPPAETGTWEGFEGVSRNLLDHLLDFFPDGYLVELVTERLGPLPYGGSLDPDDYEGACTDLVEGLPDWSDGRWHLILAPGGREVVRFASDMERLEGPRATCRVDYEILDPALDDETARAFILELYFRRFSRDCYRDRIEAFDLGRVGGPRVRAPYPVAP